jgi:lysophospholipase L1-like esterase
MKKHHHATCVAALLALLAFAGTAALPAADIAIKNGQKLAFLGDSITAAGWGNPGGYSRLVIAGCEANGIKVEGIGAGIGGHKSNQMLERLDRDVLGKKPDWMTLSCGVNDVWHGDKGVPLDNAQAAAGKYELRPGEPAKGTYKANITAIVDKAQAAGVKVMILTATVIGEELDNDNNKKLAPYNNFLRALAKEKKCLLADLNRAFQQKIKAAGNATGKPGRLLTSDSVHMNPDGDHHPARSWPRRCATRQSGTGMARSPRRRKSPCELRHQESQAPHRDRQRQPARAPQTPSRRRRQENAHGPDAPRHLCRGGQTPPEARRRVRLGGRRFRREEGKGCPSRAPKEF